MLVIVMTDLNGRETHLKVYIFRRKKKIWCSATIFPYA